jgi:hypothetical protein
MELWVLTFIFFVFLRVLYFMVRIELLNLILQKEKNLVSNSVSALATSLIGVILSIAALVCI